MSIKDAVTGVVKDIVKNASRSIIGAGIQRFANKVVDKIPDYDPSAKKPEQRIFKEMLESLVKHEPPAVDRFLLQAARQLLQRDPPERICFDFLATLEDMPDEDIDPFLKSMYNVKEAYPQFVRKS